MTDKSYITIEGATPMQVNKALKNWIKLYTKSLPKNFSINIYKVDTKKHVIVPNPQLENERFNFLVNYLNYPEDIQYKVQVHGYTVISDTKIYPKDKLNYEIEIFIPEDDHDYDNVYAVTQYNDVFKVDFGGKTTRVSIKKEFKKPDISFSNLPILEAIKIEEPDLTKIDKSQNISILKRIKIISIIIFLLFLLSFIKVGDSKTFLLINAAIAFGIWGWFSWDYKMLQRTNFYLISLAIAFIVLLYGMFLGQKIISGYSGFIRVGVALPIFFLLLQLPTRLLFKAIMKREPVVDKPAPSFADFIYIFFLFITSLIVPTVILIK
jgi:hypothetical protein